ncbi:DNA topoisomerase (ATP-hydrolyzing) subunit A [Bacillus thuringiensis]|uniref:DNA gyrase/topoisomerase IV subunit A n=1 Tax=Bacillus thuringiensis TaxID=1428 RepID=UPI0011AB223C|nr:DNA topoisomerase (ATP-hydrolyzing) [Bacillus thuringiensis]
MGVNFETISYSQEMKSSFIDYALTVVTDRALPDIRDGLKPVHRRVLYAMGDLGMYPEKAYKKSARIVGEVIGKYHPHGDSAVYESMVKLSQDFVKNAPLIDGHGNFGSVDGDSAAAMRYTEARLSPVAMEMIQDLSKGVVDFRDNFDASEKEPVVLPAKFPNLLVNGGIGIAVGMAYKTPPHSVNSAVDTLIAYADKKDIDIESLIDILEAPDYPSGGIITNKNELRDLYRTGIGKAIIRAKIDIEDAGYGRTNLVVKEIPYPFSGSKTNLITKLITMVIEKKLEEVVNVVDESDKDGIRIVLEVKKGVDIENLLNKLYSKTPLQSSESYQYLVLVDGVPTTINLKDYCKHYFDFQKEITRKKYEYLLKKAEVRKEILEGFVKAEDVMDTILEMLRGAKKSKEAKECLMSGNTEGISFKTKKHEKIAKSFSFTEKQAQAILDKRLLKLIGLEVEQLNQEYKDVLAEMEEYELVLGSEKEMLKVIKKYLRGFKKDFGRERRTEIQETKTLEYVEEVKEEDVWVLIDKFGYTKSVDTISVERSSEETLSEYKQEILTKNTSKLSVFTNQGRLYQIKLADIPKVKIKDKGIPIQRLGKMKKNEYPLYITTNTELEKEKVIMLTKAGLIKQTLCSDLITNRAVVVATKLEDNDEVIQITPIKEVEEDVLVYSKKGYVLRFGINEIPVLKKNAKGVKSVSLMEDDVIEGFYTVNKSNEDVKQLNGKQIELSKVERKARGKKGIKI